MAHHQRLLNLSKYLGCWYNDCMLKCNKFMILSPTTIDTMTVVVGSSKSLKSEYICSTRDVVGTSNNMFGLVITSGNIECILLETPDAVGLTRTGLRSYT